ncbi:MAG: hypothetical protein R3C62_15945 [Chloroflexota bacterium]
MTIDNGHLKTTVYSKIDPNNATLTLNASLLPEAAALAGYLGITGDLVLNHATPDQTTDFARVTGTVSLPSLQLVGEQTAVFTAQTSDGTTITTELAITLPAGWGIQDSFSPLPQTIQITPSSFPALADSLFNDITFPTPPSLILTNTPSTSRHLGAGINLVGPITVNTLFAPLTDLLQNILTLDLTGLITLAATAGQPPTIDLRARSTALNQTLHLGQYPLEDLFIRLWTYQPDQGAPSGGNNGSSGDDDNSDSDDAIPDTRLGVGGTLAIGSLKPIVVTTTVTGGFSGLWTLLAEPDDMAGQASFSGFGDLAGLVGGDQTLFTLPPSITDSGLMLKEIALGFQVEPPDLRFVHAAVTTDHPWSPIPALGDKFQMKLNEAGWTLVKSTSGYGNAGYVSGDLTWNLGSGKILDLAVNADFDTTNKDFNISGELTANQGGIISSSDILAYVGLSDPNLPVLTLEDLYVGANLPKKTFNTHVALDGTWQFAIGSLQVSIDSQMIITLQYATNWSGSFHGQATILDDITLSADYAFPSNDFSIEGRATDLNLWKIIEVIFQGLDAPLNVTPNATLQKYLDIQNPYIAIAKTGSDYMLKLGGEWDLGDGGLKVIINFEMMKGTQLGIIVGVQLQNLSGSALSSATGMDALKVFDDFFTTANLMMALSTSDQNASFAFDIPTLPPELKMVFPSDVVQIRKGITFMAMVEFSRLSDPNSLIYKILQKLNLADVAVIGAVQVTPDNFILFVGVSVETAVLTQTTPSAPTTPNNNLPLNGQFGGGDNHLKVVAYLKMQADPLEIALGGWLEFDMTTNSGPFQFQRGMQFGIAITVVANGFTLVGTMMGTWQNVFGLTGVDLSNAAIVIGVDWEGLPTLGFAGTLTTSGLTDQGFQGSLAIIVNSENPAQSVLSGAVSDLTLADIVHTLAGIATTDFDDVFKEIAIEGYPEHALTYSTDLENALNVASQGGSTKNAAYNAAVQAIQSAFAAASDETITTQLLVVKPENTTQPTWYITDNGHELMHYELTQPTVGGSISVAKEAQLYIAPEASDWGNGLKFDQGFHVSGIFKFLLLEVAIDIEVDKSKGAYADVYLAPIILGDKRLFSIVADQAGLAEQKKLVATGELEIPPGGPYLSFSTYDRPDAPPNLQKPHFFMSGDVTILLASFGITVEFSPDHFLIHVEDSSILTSFEFDATVGSDGFSGAGSFTLGENTLDLGALGKMTLPGFDAGLGLGWNKPNNTIEAALHFGVTLPIIGHKEFLNVQVDYSTKELAALAGIVWDEIKSFFLDLFKDVEKWLEWVKNGVVVLAEKVAQVLKDFFKKTWQEAAQLLHDIGYAAEQIIDDIKDAFQEAEEKVREFVNTLFEDVKECVVGTAYEVVG